MATWRPEHLAFLFVGNKPLFKKTSRISLTFVYDKINTKTFLNTLKQIILKSVLVTSHNTKLRSYRRLKFLALSVQALSEYLRDKI